MKQTGRAMKIVRNNDNVIYLNQYTTLSCVKIFSAPVIGVIANYVQG